VWWPIRDGLGLAPYVDLSTGDFALPSCALEVEFTVFYSNSGNNSQGQVAYFWKSSTRERDFTNYSATTGSFNTTMATNDTYSLSGRQTIQLPANSSTTWNLWAKATFSAGTEKILGYSNNTYVCTLVKFRGV
jgi:hypothetical protein